MPFLLKVFSIQSWSDHTQLATIAFDVILLLLSAFALLFAVDFIRKTREDSKVRALGGFAAARGRTWAPFGLDFLYRGFTSAYKHRLLEFYSGIFVQAHRPKTLASVQTIDCRVAGERFVFTVDPENIKAILATQFLDFGKSELFLKDWKDFLGYSIFTTDGELWHNSRMLIRPQFVKSRVSDLKIFEKHVRTLIECIPKYGQEIDISDLFFRYTLDSATDFLLGKSSGSLQNPQVQFAQAFAEAQRVQNLIARSGPFVPLIPRSSFQKAIREIDEFVEPFIERALRLSQKELDETSKSDEGYNFLHALVSYTRDRKILRDQIVAVLLAGRDTTAATLSWTFHELSRRPAIVAKLRKEILERLGPNKAPTYDDLKSMKYLQHIINETLRLYPAVPFNMRFSLTDTSLPRGGGPDGSQPVGIPKYTACAYATLLMQRSPEVYADQEEDFPDILQFVPERFEKWTPKAWTYIPFNGGPRICIGQQWALTEMGYTLVRLFQEFDHLERYYSEEDVQYKAEIVLQPGNGVKVGLRKAKKNEDAVI